MNTTSQKKHLIGQIPDCDPHIGRWLWALEDTRDRTRRHINSLHPRALDLIPNESGNSISTLLYHIAAIEASWLFTDVLEEEFSPDVDDLFPHNVRDELGRLTNVHGISMEGHFQRLDHVRAILLGTYREMTLTEFRRSRSIEDHIVSPEWVIHHLIQHEAEHRGQIMAVSSQVNIK